MKVKNNEKILEMEDNITRQKENRLSVYWKIQMWVILQWTNKTDKQIQLNKTTYSPNIFHFK
jgi:hypothetical protein